MIGLLSLITGILNNEINAIENEQSKRAEMIYSIPSIEKDIDEIKADVKDIRQILKLNYDAYLKNREIMQNPIIDTKN